MATSDEELMQRVGHGDAAAFEELFDRRRLPLLRFLSRLVKDPTLAEDLVQDAFLRVWQHRASFDGRAQFSTWLYTIAYRQALKELDRRGHAVAHFSELSEREAEETEHSRVVGGSAAREETEGEIVLRMELQKALQTLPFEQRTSLVLRAYEERSFREIGNVLGCSEGNARILAHRARQALRALLGPLLERRVGACDDQ